MKRNKHNRNSFSYKFRRLVYRLVWETDYSEGIKELFAGIGIFVLIFLFMFFGLMFR